MKFNVGDKVRVRKDLSEEHNKYGVNSDMQPKAGQIVTIEAIYGDEIRIEEDSWTWTEDCFESVDAREDGKFKVGDIVESKPGNPGEYSITIPGRKLKVLEVSGDTILVEMLDDHLRGETFYVTAAFFDLKSRATENPRIPELKAEIADKQRELAKLMRGDSEEPEEEEPETFDVDFDDDCDEFDMDVDCMGWSLRVQKDEVKDFFQDPDYDRVQVVSLDEYCLPEGFTFETDEDGIYIVRER